METTPRADGHTGERGQTKHVDALIQDYAPLVTYLAQRLTCRLPAWIGLDDLISAGVLGLMDAIAKYDPTRGTTFKTYAEIRIRGAMLDALREWDWVPRSVRQKEHALTHAYAELERQHGRPATDEDVAAVLGLDCATFSAWLSDVRGVSVVSLDTPRELDVDGHTGTVLAQLVDDTPGPLQLVETEDF